MIQKNDSLKFLRISAFFSVFFLGHKKSTLCVSLHKSAVLVNKKTPLIYSEVCLGYCLVGKKVFIQ